MNLSTFNSQEAILMGKVVSLSERLEKWGVTYTSPDGRLQVMTSSHGRIVFRDAYRNSDLAKLDFVESVMMMTKLSEDMSFDLETK